jgi:CBS domain containing-hemolysin-like protein
MITLEDVLGELLGAVPDEFKAPRVMPRPARDEGRA